MTAFIDTNVLVYSRDESEPERQPVAAAWLDLLWTTGEGRVSFQVLNEYYVTVTRKLSPGLDLSVARADIGDLMSWRPSKVDDLVLAAAWRIEDSFGLPWWDALIVASAQVGGCDRLLSEDLQDGQQFGVTTVVDPFRHDPT